jgi:hypothetical protein
VSIDPERVVAIDIHVHAEVGPAGEDRLLSEWRRAAAASAG